MVNIYKLKLTNLQRETLRLLYIKAGTTLNQRHIAKKINVSPPAITKALPGLEKAGFIKIFQDKETKRWSIELNRENHKIMQLKRVDNLQQVYESGLADFLEKECAGATIVLFGSYSRGDDTVTSDIDVAIIGRKEKQVHTAKYEMILERKIHMSFYESWQKIHKNLKENLCNGIILTGGVEL